MDEHQPARRAVYVISVAAELAGVHPQTLRIYERRGLIEPARTKGGSRRYSDHDLAQLRSIQELTAEGVSLEGVRRFIEMQRELDATKHELAETQDALADTEDALKRVERETHRKYKRELVLYRGAVVPWAKHRR
ncbi:MAG: helix-turn-helix transcriptional regulator [Actinobacteria bacterium]|nr:helix-turn-helix transcriptional regulator [Actinomycetota bacterium]MCB9390111.1 helix-turn-helix transcriptional regulator [Acidimicrobiia bacterium]